MLTHSEMGELIMKAKSTMPVKVASLIIAAVNFAVALLMTLRLPETVPIHFNADWVCDNTGSRYVALLTAALPFLVAAALFFSDHFTKESNRKVTLITVIIMELYFVALHWITYPLYASGVTVGEQTDPQAVSWALPLLMSVLFVMIGNYLPVVQPNHTLGIRVKWTLEDENCWQMTHRFAGRLWVITGLITAAAIIVLMALHVPAELWIFIVLGELFTAAVAVPTIYAYLHRKEEQA